MAVVTNESFEDRMYRQREDLHLGPDGKVIAPTSSQRAEVLSGVIVTPDQSPPCGSVIQFRVQLGGRTYDYASIRAGDGKWYTTGDKALQGVDWRTLIDAVKHKLVGPIQVLGPVRQVML